MGNDKTSNGSGKKDYQSPTETNSSTETTEVTTTSEEVTTSGTDEPATPEEAE